MKLLITGGSGFIGSAVVRRVINDSSDEVVNLDLLTYASSGSNLRDIEKNPRYSFEHGDICNIETVRDILARHKPHAIMHLAAESHVDRSIHSPDQFIQTNIVGTQRLLSAAQEYFDRLSEEKKQLFRFHHISTDEVYGALGETGFFTESTPYNPRSPYSASKAASDHLVSAWFHTYGLPVLISNCSNNYGPYQFPEKLIPLITINCLLGQPLPVYGRGKNVRDWLFVDDHVSALRTVLREGKPGESYLIGGGSECSNIDVVLNICAIVDELAPASPFRPHDKLIKFVADRPGHDHRYAIDFSKMKRDLHWEPSVTFLNGLRRTVEWYIDNRSWWEPLLREKIGKT